MQSDLKAFRISHDEILRTVYGSQIDESDFRLCCERVNRLVWRQVEQACQCKVDVILEGWGTRELRDQARAELNKMGADYEFIYVECAREVRFERVMRRNEALNDEGFFISEEEFNRMEKLREELDDDEEGSVISN
jgi:predicted kinase